MRTAVLVFLVMATLTPLLALEPDDQVTVHIRSAEVRESPQFLGKPVATVEYEATGTVLEVRGDWARVEFTDPAVTGWIHGSALEAPRQQGGLRALAGRGSTSSFGASEDEVALAGRGFNDKVEAKYKEQTKLDFSQVDRMEEEFGQPVDALGEFLATADLTLGEADE